MKRGRGIAGDRRSQLNDDEAIVLSDLPPHRSVEHKGIGGAGSGGNKDRGSRILVSRAIRDIDHVLTQVAVLLKGLELDAELVIVGALARDPSGSYRAIGEVFLHEVPGAVGKGRIGIISLFF